MQINALEKINTNPPPYNTHQRTSWIAKTEHTMFMLSIFLYPIVSMSHVLYLIPLMILLGLSITNRHKRLYTSDYAAMAAGVAAFIIPFAVEFSSQTPSQELTSKLIVNAIGIMIIAGNERFSLSYKSLNNLRVFCIIWILIALVVYVKSGVTSLSAVWMQLNASSEMNSSSLYGIAEPLRDIFLTKNISAMFVVIFFIAVLVFLSRQAIMGMIIIYGLYRFIVAGHLNKVIIVTVLITCATIFFTAFFNLNNSNDGASQRLLLWSYFLSHYQNFFLLGLGVSDLNATLISNYGIDNFHMFFMNQIGAYGFIHFIFFSAFLILIYIRKGSQKGRILLATGYLLNVCFQTYGYEYGNLFLFMAMFASINTNKTRTIKFK
ncbi:hypothetical protein AZ019_002717 [Klebsiella pneumoniae]|uniref:hypothetical protein n=1 Tax=Klebsiella pneumoniae TaxID=573 RepID=UPI000A3D05C2|nr:hypothetical protein [Klebsiella pneumoniae]OUH41807.1 hypothetical protein AZ019_002717 [Klebsiella pneumoniae]